jgi:hypothetical protein
LHRTSAYRLSRVVVQSGLVLARNQDVVAALGLNGPGMGPATSARWFERHAEARQGRSGGGSRDLQLLSAAGVAAVMAWWGVLQARVVQVRHRAGVETAWHQPSGFLRQRLPAVNGIARSLSHGATLARPPDPPQPVQLCRQWPGAVLQVLQVAAAVERPAIDVAGPAPPIAGLRRARMGVVGLRPASAAPAFVQPGSRREGDLAGPASLLAGH